MVAQMTVVSELDIDRLSDLILKKMEGKFLRMPKEWRDNVQRGYMLPPVQIRLTEPRDHDEEFHSHNWIMEMYIPENGGLLMRVKDEWGRQILERTFL